VFFDPISNLQGQVQAFSAFSNDPQPQALQVVDKPGDNLIQNLFSGVTKRVAQIMSQGQLR
jgi:hypothetical protein